MEMVQKIESLRNLLIKTMKIGGYLYGVDITEVSDLTRELNSNLNTIRDQSFTVDDINQYRHSLLFDNLRAILCVDGVQELKETYSKKIYVNPVSFLDDSECFLQVKAVFICLLLKHNDNKRCSIVKYEDLLEYSDSTANVAPVGEEMPSMLLVEGCVGSGKTTLLKLLISEWVACTGSIKGLSEYDLILHLECRDSFTDSLTKLLVSDMPETVSKVRRNDLLHIALSLKILVLIDGLDELNMSSENFLSEILHIMTSTNISLVCTTRPEKIKDIQKMASGKVKIVHLKILGIPHEKREDFLGVYHEELKQRGLSQQDTKSLIQYINQAPTHVQGFLSSPLNLVLLVFIWARAHERISRVTSSTTLYIEIHNLLKEKLYERLKHNPVSQHLTLTEIEEKCQHFLSAIYQEALNSLSRGEVYLDLKITRKLKDLCSKLGLPSEELFSAFLTLRSIKTPSGLVSELHFPHKGIHDFYAANWVASLITETPFTGDDEFMNELNIFFRQMKVPDYHSRQVKLLLTELGKPRTIRSVLEELHQGCKNTLDNSKYRNVLYNLAGLVKILIPDGMEKYAREIVELLKESANTPFDYLVNMLKEADFDINLAKEISKYVPKFYWTVTDEHVQAATRLLCYDCPYQLTIDISGDPSKVVELDSLLEVVSGCSCSVTLYLHYHWRYPRSGLSDTFLRHLRTELSLASTSHSDAGASRDDLHIPAHDASGQGSQDDLLTLSYDPMDQGSRDDLHIPAHDALGQWSHDDLRTPPSPIIRSHDDSHTPDAAATSVKSKTDLTALHTHSRDDLFSGQKSAVDQPPQRVRSRLTELMGHLGASAAAAGGLLPKTLKELRLSLADDHQLSRWGQVMPYLCSSLPHLLHIWVHVVVGVSPRLLPRLPHLRYRPRLYLSGVGDADAEWACDTARALLPPQSKFASICLPRSEMSEHGMTMFIQGLYHRGVGVYGGKSGGLLVESPNLKNSLQLSSFVLKRLNCTLSKVDKEEIWYDESGYERCYDYSNLLVNKLLGTFEDSSQKNLHAFKEQMFLANDVGKKAPSPVEDLYLTDFEVYEQPRRSGQAASPKSDDLYESIPEPGHQDQRVDVYSNHNVFASAMRTLPAQRPPRPLPRQANSSLTYKEQSFSTDRCKRADCKKRLSHSCSKSDLPPMSSVRLHPCSFPVSINMSFNSHDTGNFNHGLRYNSQDRCCYSCKPQCHGRIPKFQSSRPYRNVHGPDCHGHAPNCNPSRLQWHTHAPN
nr:uncharacterized protein LOC128695132 [Cherax quadricarinatus]